MKVLLLIPALLYLGLILLNLQIFQESTQINFFWLYQFEIPVVIFISIFFILYIILIWIGFNFSNFFSNYKNRKLEKEVFDLKGKLLGKQGDLIQEIQENFAKVLQDFKDDSNKKLELYKKENDKIVTNMQYDFTTLKEKIEKLSKNSSK